MWRLFYFALLVLVGTKSIGATVLNPGKVLALSELALRLAPLPLGLFAIWAALAYVRTDVPARNQLVRERWRAASLHALDRSLLFVASVFFFALLPPVKMSFPDANGFWADPYLIAFDRWLFGTDPWLLTHALLGPATPVMEAIYSGWIAVVVLSSLAVGLLAGETVLARFYTGLALIWTVLAIVVAEQMVSAGPLFGPQLGFGFEPLVAELQRSAPLTILAKTYLWEAHSTGVVRIGAGISAAPSIHCAISFLFVFASWRTRLFPLAVAYATVIWLGSVHLGWHYFADGLISLAGVALLWPLCLWAATWRWPVWQRARALQAA
jgi:hypothetical protein